MVIKLIVCGRNMHIKTLSVFINNVVVLAIEGNEETVY